jgi:hypothetical protein
MPMTSAEVLQRNEDCTCAVAAGTIGTQKARPFAPVRARGGGGFVKLQLTVGTGTAEAVFHTGASQSAFNERAAALDGLESENARRRAEETRAIDGRWVDSYPDTI